MSSNCCSFGGRGSLLAVGSTTADHVLSLYHIPTSTAANHHNSASQQQPTQSGKSIGGKSVESLTLLRSIRHSAASAAATTAAAVGGGNVHRSTHLVAPPKKMLPVVGLVTELDDTPLLILVGSNKEFPSASSSSTTTHRTGGAASPLLGTTSAAPSSAAASSASRQSSSNRILQVVDMTGPTVLAEMAFPTPVLQVRVNALRLVVIVLRETYVYDLATLTLVATIGTTTPLNADGIGSLSAVRVAATGHALITQGSFSAASRASFHGEGNAAAAPFGRKSSSAAPAGYLALPVQDVQMHHSPSAHLLAERSRAGSTAGMMLLRGYSGAAGGGMWDGGDGDDMSALRSARERAAAAAAAAANPVGVVALFDASNARLISHFEAHRHALTQLEFSPCGNRLATCSAKGTTIRVFSIPAGTMLHLLRRGQREALVHSISFNRSGEAIAVSSASGTVHVFRTAPQQQQDPQQSTASAAKGAGGGGIADRVELMMGTLQSTMGGWDAERGEGAPPTHPCVRECRKRFDVPSSLDCVAVRQCDDPVRSDADLRWTWCRQRGPQQQQQQR